MALSIQRKLAFLLLAFVSAVLLVSVVYAQSSIPPIQPGSTPTSELITSCAPNSASDEKCTIYAIARENMEKHWPGCSIINPTNCPVIPSGASGLPPGITPGQRIDTDVIVNAIVLRLEGQSLPTNPPKDWESVLAAKRNVMSGIMNALGSTNYKGPTMIDFRPKRPKRTSGSEGGSGSESGYNVPLAGLVFTKFLRFFELTVPSVSAQTPAPTPQLIPLVITVSFTNPDGTTYRHSMFCWGTGVNWATGDGHYVCHNHKNQGSYIYILDSKDEKITGERLPPFAGPNVPQEPIIKVTGTLEVIISHNVPR